MTQRLQQALKDIKAGRMVLIFDSDDRERETDMVIASEAMNPSVLMEMRRNAGGLICVTCSDEIASRLDLPFLADVLADAAGKHGVLRGLAPNDLPYDTKSAFSISINHRRTFTGVTDIDRAHTISEFGHLCAECPAMSPEDARKRMGRDFRAPGHIHLLRASRDPLSKRFGHTELSTAIMMLAGATPSATLCEMMGDDGNALSKERAKAYATANGLCFLEGKDIIEAWREQGRKA
jgi:3,4-dihydroxy 2-butanone 4-phosphate synthase